MQFLNLELGALVAGVFCVLVVWFYFKKAQKKRVNLILSRPTLEISEIYNRFFIQSGVSESSFRMLWKELSNTLELPPGRLLPSDRFNVELSPEKGYEFNDQINDVKYLISKRCNKTGVDESTIRTLEDYILVFGKDGQ